MTLASPGRSGDHPPEAEEGHKGRGTAALLRFSTHPRQQQQVVGVQGKVRFLRISSSVRS